MLQLKNYGNTMSVLGEANVEDALKKVTDELGKGWQEWSELASDDQLEEIRIYCEKVRRKFENVVVLGIGGSALGTAAIANALLHLKHNELPREKRNAPRFFVEDNIDPERMQALFDVIDIRTSCFIVISKSGETLETLSRFLIVYDMLEKASDHFIIITSAEKGELYSFAVKEGIKLFTIGEGIGGRFSVFSPVGLVPLSCVGIDIKAIIDGARKASRYCVERDIHKNPALMMAAVNVEAYRRGCNINVLMPYAESLRLMADMFAQFWGESLGKKLNLKGEVVHVGQTPVKSLGVTDQHSQLQLYAEGPFDKIITFIGVKRFRNDFTIPSNESLSNLEYLKGHTLNELMNIEREATAEALIKANRPIMTIELDEIDCGTIGELVTVFMYETAYAGAMLDVDTYNQPGVEEGKRLAYSMLCGSGSHEKNKL